MPSPKGITIGKAILFVLLRRVIEFASAVSILAGLTMLYHAAGWYTFAPLSEVGFWRSLFHQGFLSYVAVIFFFVVLLYAPAAGLLELILLWVWPKGRLILRLAPMIHSLPVLLNFGQSFRDDGWPYISVMVIGIITFSSAQYLSGLVAERVTLEQVKR